MRYFWSEMLGKPSEQEIQHISRNKEFVRYERDLLLNEERELLEWLDELDELDDDRIWELEKSEPDLQLLLPFMEGNIKK